MIEKRNDFIYEKIAIVGVIIILLLTLYYLIKLPSDPCELCRIAGNICYPDISYPIK